MAGIYLHIPFCKQACSYCDFHFSTSLKSKNAFIDALIREMELQKNFFGENELVETVYFGGGTPSLLSVEEIDRIFKILNKYYSISKDAEITLEANPDDLNKAKLRELKQSPVNRLSIGIQSFFEADLKLMNRAHNSFQAENCIGQSLDEGFENLTVDLIYGTPGLSNENWKKNLEKVFQFGINHLSCYSLTVEEKTPLHSYIRKGKVQPLNEEQSAKQFLILMEETARNGYEHYEISNFCKPGFYSRHNSSYWTGEKYLGLGPSAHSFDGNTRQWNIANNFHYIASIEEEKIPCEKEMLTTEQKFNEYVLVSLRTSKGIDIEKTKSVFGKEFLDHILLNVETYINSNKVRLIENRLMLTNEGKLLADRISSDLFV